MRYANNHSKSIDEADHKNSSEKVLVPKKVEVQVLL